MVVPLGFFKGGGDSVFDKDGWLFQYNMKNASGLATTFAADFDGIDAYLSVADNASLSHGGTVLTAGCWFNPGDVSGNQSIFGKYNTTGDAREYLCWLNGSTLQSSFSSDGTSGGSSFSTANRTGITANKWYFVVIRFDASDVNTLFLGDEDGGALLTSTDSTITSIHEGAAAFTVGAQAPGANYLHGGIENLFLFHDDLSDDEITWLYNAGEGRSHGDIDTSPDTDNPGTTNLVSFYKLDESGTADRVDSEGTNDLTESGGVVLSDGHYRLEPAVNDEVSIAIDQSAAGNDATAVFADRPKLTADGVTFPNVGDRFTVAGLSESADDLILFAVVDSLAGATGDYIMDIQTGRLVFAPGGTNGLYFYGASWNGTSFSGTDGGVLVYRLEAAGTECYKNGGTADFTGSYTQQAVGGTVAIGNRFLVTGDNNYNDALQWLGLFKGTMTDAEINEAGDSLATDFGFTWTDI